MRGKSHDTLILLWDFNTKMEEEVYWRTVSGREIVHHGTNDNGTNRSKNPCNRNRYTEEMPTQNATCSNPQRNHVKSNRPHHYSKDNTKNDIGGRIIPKSRLGDRDRKSKIENGGKKGKTKQKREYYTKKKSRSSKKSEGKSMEE